MAKALLYLRVSSTGQRLKESPIAAQKAACLEFAKANEFVVDEEKDIYKDDGISGRSTAHRDNFKAMMERVKTDKEVGVVVAYDISRISRNLMVYLQFKDQLKKADTKFFSVSEPYFNDDSPVSKLIEQILGGFAEFRSGQDGGKIKESMKQKAEAGVFPAKASYGYKNIHGDGYGGKNKNWIETDPVTSVWVKNIFAWYASGQYSFRDLVEKINNEGCPSANKRPWCLSSLEKLLKNKVYIGWVEWGEVSNPNGTQEHLIDDRTFNKVQAIMEARSFSADKSWKHVFMLRGISWCGECGSRIQASYHTKKSGRVYAHYCCPAIQHGRQVECNQSVVQVHKLENQVKGLIKYLQIPESTADKLVAKIQKVATKDIQSGDEMKKAINIQLANIKTRGERLLEKFLDGNVDDVTYKNYKAELEQEQSKLITDLERVDETTTKMAREIEMAVALAKNCYRTFKTASFDQKVVLIRTLFAKLVIRDGKIVEAWVNHPYAYIARKNLGKDDAFLRMISGGDGGNRTLV